MPEKYKNENYKKSSSPPPDQGALTAIASFARSTDGGTSETANYKLHTGNRTYG